MTRRVKAMLKFMEGIVAKIAFIQRWPPVQGLL
jgi:hypothetical protein